MAETLKNTFNSVSDKISETCSSLKTKYDAFEAERVERCNKIQDYDTRETAAHLYKAAEYRHEELVKIKHPIAAMKKYMAENKASDCPAANSTRIDMSRDFPNGTEDFRTMDISEIQDKLKNTDFSYVDDEYAEYQ